MIEELMKILDEDIFKYFEDPGSWKTLFIDYHKPYVERAYRDLDSGSRLSIHRIHTCTEEEALLHPHPWPAAFIVLGSYAMSMGQSETLEKPEILSRFWLQNSAYEILDKNTWHKVSPINDSCMTIMLSGKPWDREMPIKPTKSFRELTDTELEALLRHARYGLTNPKGY
jgi:hypothetical protein